jgi:hypothetical protein
VTVQVPKPGEAIHYADLWHEEFVIGQEEHRKD